MQLLPAFLTRRSANAIGFLICCGLIGYALYAQYVQLLEPCSMCWFQRFAVAALGVVFFLAMVHNPGQVGARIYGIVLAVVAVLGVAIAGRHIWIQAQPPGSVPSCGASMEYLFEIMPALDVIKKVLSGSAECQHVDTLLGISWPWWTATAMTILGLWGVIANWKLKR